MSYASSFLSKTACSLLATGLLVALAATPAAAGDPQAGRKKALQCQACHGLDGIAKIPEAPSLAGESTLYLEKQLRAFRDGARTDPRMSIIARGLSDADIADLAAWYAAIEVTAKMPEF